MSKFQVGKQYITPGKYLYTFLVKSTFVSTKGTPMISIVWTRESTNDYDVPFTSTEEDFLERGARLITKLDKALK